MASKKDVQRELKNLQKRLKTFETRTGFKYTVDEAYYMTQKNRKKAVNELKSLMRWKEADVGIRMGKHIEVKSTGELHYKYVKGTYIHELNENYVKQLVRAINRTYKNTGVLIKPNIAGPNLKNAVKGAIKFVSKYDTKTKIMKHHNKMQENAINNMRNKIKNAAEVSGKAGMQAFYQFLEKNNFLYARYDLDKYNELTAKLKFNIYGSKSTDQAKILGNIKDFVSAMLDYLGVTEQQFIDTLQAQGASNSYLNEVIIDLDLDLDLFEE